MDLNSIPGGSIQMVINSLNRFGIVNPFLQAGILATASKETGFKPISEFSYKNTSAERLRKIFPSSMKNYSDAEIDQLKKNDVAFFDRVYGGKYGNTKVGDGFKYRGRGFNGITFKDLYKRYGDRIGVDLVSDPDKLNDPQIASDVLAVYFVDTINAAVKDGRMKKKLGVEDPGKIQDIDSAVKIGVQANAGFGTPWNNYIVQKGYHEALANAPFFYNFIQASSFVNPVVETFISSDPKKKRIRRIGLAVIGGTALIGTAAAIYHSRKR